MTSNQKIFYFNAIHIFKYFNELENKTLLEKDFYDASVKLLTEIDNDFCSLSEKDQETIISLKKECDIPTNIDFDMLVKDRENNDDGK